MAVTFHQAYESAVQRYSPEVWQRLGQSDQVTAIYDEMRRMGRGGRSAGRGEPAHCHVGVKSRTTRYLGTARLTAAAPV